MIDGIKILNLPVNLPDLTNNELIEFVSSVNETTGEVETRTGIFRELIFTIKGNRYIRLYGSVHKYFNNGSHNYNDLAFANLVEVIIDLHIKFKIDPFETRLNNLEFGVNIETPYNPDIFLKSVINHKGDQFNITWRKNYHFIECIKQRYIIKIYNKGLQYGQPGNILRFEIKIIKMEQLREVGITRLSDLLAIEKFQRLGAELVRYFDDLLVYDPTITKNLNARERLILSDGKNPKYWEELKEKKPNSYYKKRNRFRELVEKYGSNNLQDSIRELIIKKVNDLLRVTPETLQKITDFLQLFPDQNTDQILQKLNDFQKTEFTDINHSNNKLIPININTVQNAVCKVTGIDISNQHPGSKFIRKKGVLSLYYYDPEKFKQLEKKYGSMKLRFLTIRQRSYYIAHNIRNADSNPRNLLKRKLQRYENENWLFDVKPFLIINHNTFKVTNRKINNVVSL